jgi:spore maturation protein CgeB
MKIVICGLSVSSSWGNGHATTFRALMKGLAARGHDVLFLERDVPWYAAHRDLPSPPFGRTRYYSTLEELYDGAAAEVREADLVVVGSFVPEGIRVGDWVLREARGVTAFYDIDTPVTLSHLANDRCFYVSAAQMAAYRLYLSFTGGPILDRLREAHGAAAPRPLYCSVDPELYRPLEAPRAWDLGYMGTYSPDRQPTLDGFLVDTARERPGRRMVVAGSRYPAGLAWPENVDRIEHLPPADHARFYASQAFTLNVTRRDMVRAGHSPSVRLFEAAACGVPVISDAWPGLDVFFRPEEEILVARSTADVRGYLDAVGEDERRSIGERARRRVLAEHTAERRAEDLEGYVHEARA